MFPLIIPINSTIHQINSVINVSEFGETGKS